MSPRVLLRIAIALAVALAAWGLLALLQRRATDRPVAFALPHLAGDSADAISYLGPQDTIQLSRVAGVWQVNGHRAAPRVVQAFFRALSDSNARSELIAESAASHERLGVDSVKGKHLTVSAGGKRLLDLWFGNRGPDFEGFYVRRTGDPRVFLLKGTFADLSVQPLADWRDRQILALAPDSVGRVVVARGRKGFTLERSGKGWSLGPGPAPDSLRVAHFLGQFGELRATGFPTAGESDSARFDPATRRVSLYGLHGEPLAEMALDSLASGFLLKVGTSSDLFKLDSRLADAIAPEPGTLIK